MSNVVDRFNKRAPENAIHYSRLNKEGCRLSKKNVPKPNVVIDLDKLEIAGDSTRADYLIASDDNGGWILAIEMKKGAPDVRHSAKQLRSAAEIANNWASGEKVENFRAVLVSGSMPIAENILLKKRRNWVRFGNKDYQIRRLKCGSELRLALK